MTKITGKFQISTTAADRLRFFDLATERQQRRQKRLKLKPSSGRGWSGDELYERRRTD